MAHPTSISSASSLQVLESFILDLQAQIEAKGAEVYRLQTELAAAKEEFKRSTKQIVSDWEEKFRKAGLRGFNVEDGETDSEDNGSEIVDGAYVEGMNSEKGIADNGNYEDNGKRKVANKQMHAIVNSPNGMIKGPINEERSGEGHSETSRLSELFWSPETKDDAVQEIEGMLGSIATLLGDWSIVSKDQLGNVKRRTTHLQTRLRKDKDDEKKMVKYFESLEMLEERLREFKDCFGYDEQTFKGRVAVPEALR